ncbi:indole-3-acetaldehyde oxidase-like [Ctenocephalides felis]|uniref:indole-3-acetaldehyde oxidase-like n=1 Tax=Ctenocephalides felis TaxID=7515 RepID=UPI000E6E1FAF|nr:indole-3-acetaldehyde oxidase-like [Ctenocephalides felis]
MLIAGNTANGVYRNQITPKLFIDINGVSELRKHIINSNIILGANINLTETMLYLTEYSKVKGFEYVLELVKHIDLVANVPVRNVGTIAGNLMLKHQHPEFPSDIFLILELVEAKLTIMDICGSKFIVSPANFLDMDMVNKVIVNIILPPIRGKYNLKTYKIMIRAQNAHAYVNAGFCLNLNPNTETVEKAKLVFGGIAPTFIHATKTEKLLLGMNLFDNNVLKSTLEALHAEIEPDWILPDASPEYRKNLAISLFYKFVLQSCPTKNLSSKNVFGRELLFRGLSSGHQKYDTNKSSWPLQKPISKIEGLAQCSGEAQYIIDIPPFPNELYGAFVLSTKAGAEITKIDVSKALATEGVVAFFSAKDIPGKNTFINMTMLLASEEEELFPEKTVKYVGQPIGVIVAASQTLAVAAAKLIDIQYSHEGNPKINVQDIITNDKENRVKCKMTVDAKNQGENIDNIIRGTMEMGTQYHYTMETHVAICVPIEDGIDVYSSTQWIDAVQIAVADVLNIPVCKVNLAVRRIGGGYGMKISRSNLVAAACALAAYKLKKPIRIVTSFEDTMNAFGKRYGCINDYEVAFNKRGKIQYLKNSFYQDHGCSENESVLAFTMGVISNCYDMSSWDIKAYSVVTDTPSNTFCRAPGSAEATAMIENIMEHIAYVLGLEPLEVRLENMRENDNLLLEIIDEFRKKTDYDHRKTEINKFNKQNRWRKRGISIVPLMYPLEYLGNFCAMVCIYHGDGTAIVTHGGIECGQGINTKAAQVCAYALGLPLSMVQVKPSSALTAPNAYLTGGSSTSEACCYAVLEACKTLLKRLAPLREKYENPPWKNLIAKAFDDGVDLQATAFCDTKNNVDTYNIAGLTNCEVEIDILTGNVMILRVDLLEDTGDSMSPEIDVGQVEGAFVMGLGYWLNEQIIYDDKTGELLTNRTWTYKPPGAKDIPIDFRVEFIRNSKNPLGVLRSKATGEPPFCMAFSADLKRLTIKYFYFNKIVSING